MNLFCLRYYENMLPVLEVKILEILEKKTVAIYRRFGNNIITSSICTDTSVLFMYIQMIILFKTYYYLCAIFIFIHMNQATQS